MSACVPVRRSASQQQRLGKDRGGWVGVGVLAKGSQGTHRSACLWSLHYRIWHSARAHLISLRTHTHTYTHISACRNAHMDKPGRTTSTPPVCTVMEEVSFFQVNLSHTGSWMLMRVWLTGFVNICFPDGAGAGVTSLERAFSCCVTAPCERVFVWGSLKWSISERGQMGH